MRSRGSCVDVSRLAGEVNPWFVGMGGGKRAEG